MEKLIDISWQYSDLELFEKITPDKLDQLICTLENAQNNTMLNSQITLVALRQAMLPFFNLEDPADINNIINLISNFCEIVRDQNVSIEDLKILVDRAVDSEGSDVFKEHWKEISAGFFKILNSSYVQCVSKANMLAYDYSNLFHNAGLITDLRPVFDKNADNILGFVVVNTLRIQYWVGDEFRELSFALDINDIIRLQILCARAIKKAEVATDIIQSKIELPVMFVGDAVNEQSSDQ